MMSKEEELAKAIQRGFENKAKKLLRQAALDGDASILGLLESAIEKEISNGSILAEVVKALFRLKRQHKDDMAPFFELWGREKQIIQEALLDVLGYDRMVPERDDQAKIIERYFDFGKDYDRRYQSDPRYGLAAACAGWDAELVRPFLEHCLVTGGPPVKYVAENALKRKYVKLASRD
jgi:hypothetical protein